MIYAFAAQAELVKWTSKSINQKTHSEALRKAHICRDQFTKKLEQIRQRSFCEYIQLCLSSVEILRVIQMYRGTQVPVLTLLLNSFVILGKLFNLSFKKNILLLFNYSCLHFLPTPLPHPSQTHLPPSLASTLPLGFVYVSFIVVPENPSPHCPFPPPLWLLLDCS